MKKFNKTSVEIETENPSTVAVQETEKRENKRKRGGRKNKFEKKQEIEIQEPAIETAETVLRPNEEIKPVIEVEETSRKLKDKRTQRQKKVKKKSLKKHADQTEERQRQENPELKKLKRKKLKNKIFYTFLTLMLLTVIRGCANRPWCCFWLYSKQIWPAMGIVIISSVIIFLVLSLYSKKNRSNTNYQTSESDILKTPKTSQQAIEFFIHKNKLT